MEEAAAATAILPPLTPLNSLLAVAQVVITLLLCWKPELLSGTAAASKASAAAVVSDSEKGKKGRAELWVSSRTGMLLTYTPALVVSLRALARSRSRGSVYNLLAAMLLAHFGVREFEVVFLHRSSGRVRAALSGAAGMLYALNAVLILYAAGLTPLEQGWNVHLGVALCVLGQLGAFYHQLLLAPLPLVPRRCTGEGGEAGGPKHGQGAVPEGMPTGGLFGLVTTPQYLFELMAWLGIVCIAPRLHVALVFTSTASFLAGRSYSSTLWYKERFGSSWPSQRRHLIPWFF